MLFSECEETIVLQSHRTNQCWSWKGPLMLPYFDEGITTKGVISGVFQQAFQQEVWKRPEGSATFRSIH